VANASLEKMPDGHFPDGEVIETNPRKSWRVVRAKADDRDRQGLEKGQLVGMGGPGENALPARVRLPGRGGLKIEIPLGLSPGFRHDAPDDLATHGVLEVDKESDAAG